MPEQFLFHFLHLYPQKKGNRQILLGKIWELYFGQEFKISL